MIDSWDSDARTQAQWSEAELQQAMQESLRLATSPGQPGQPLQLSDLQREVVYFEQQVPGSDTCGLNALNNLCQARRFKLEDLQRAEAAQAQAQNGGCFAPLVPLHAAPRGFFDVEALKLAANEAQLQIVDVEPVPDYSRSRCAEFVESVKSTRDGSWFLGFLVYDRQPGEMHYYVLRRDPRQGGSVWYKLDSQLPPPEVELRNRRLSEAELRGLYESCRPLFQAWLLRWYPVVYRPGAAEQVRALLDSSGYSISLERAAGALADCRWLVTATARHLLEDLPTVTHRELLVKFARPSESEMRALLEAAKWNIMVAQPVIDEVLKQRITLARTVDIGPRTLKALSLCDWRPDRAATLIALQLQVGQGIELKDLQEALQLASWDCDRAESVLKLLSTVGTLKGAAQLLQQTSAWSIQAAEKVLQVKKRFPRVAVPVAMEVLRRNDDDPHAAGELLAEYRLRIQRQVVEQAAQGDILNGEEEAIADTALNATDWDPRNAFVTARSLALAVQKTRRILRTEGCPQHVAVDAILAALTAGDQRPEAAAAMLLGRRPLLQPQATPLEARPRLPEGPPAKIEEEESSSCVLT